MQLITNNILNAWIKQSYILPSPAKLQYLCPYPFYFANTKSYLAGLGEDDIISMLADFDEMRLWNKALTEEQIQKNRDKRLKGNEPNLIGLWNLLKDICILLIHFKK